MAEMSGQADPRLTWSTVAGLGETTPSGGGFLVPHETASAVWESVVQTGQIIRRCTRQIVTRRDGIKLPAIDETSRANGSRYGGLRLYWSGEGDTVTATKPKFRSVDLGLKKLLGLAYATDELLEDAPALESFLNRALIREATFVIENEIVNGAGTFGPLGMLRSGALITVNPESGQPLATVRAQNILDMFGRLPAGSIGAGSAVWLINSDVIPQLFGLALNGVSLYAPPTKESGSAGYLLGIPIVPVEYAATLGTLGDIVLVDPGEYLVAEQAPLFLSSIHVKFIEREQAFRFSWRIDGQPGWRTPITPLNSTTTVSPFVTLGTR